MNKLKRDTDLINNFKYAPAKAVQAVDRLIKLKNTKSPWEVIAEIVKIWQSTEPKEWKSFIVTMKNVKATRKVTSVGNKQFSGVTKNKGSYGRALLDIPTRVMRMIRAIYKAEDLPMDKKFYDKFAKKFPMFVVWEKV